MEQNDTIIEYYTTTLATKIATNSSSTNLQVKTDSAVVHLKVFE